MTALVASPPIEPLWQADPFDATLGRAVRGGELPAELRAHLAGPLAIPLRLDRPTVVANFVSTLDGVVALDRVGATGGREISGDFDPDRFLMGLLRSIADAVVVGAGTVRASHSHAWTPGGVHPQSASAYARWREELGLTAAEPTTVVVSASGDVDPDHPGLSDPRVPVIVATTTSGLRRLTALGRRAHVELVALAGEGRVPVPALLALLRDRGFALVLSEGGPTLFGDLLAARAVDQLFLTLAPQAVGRGIGAARLGLVEGTGFVPTAAPWARLLSVSRAADHLFLRYDFSHSDQGGTK